MEFKGTKGWVLDKEGYIKDENFNIIADFFITSEKDLANAKLASKAPEMLKELEESIIDLLCIQRNVNDALKTDNRWDGIYEILQRQIDRKKQLIKQATEL